MVNSRKGRPTVKKMPRVAKKYERKAYSIQFKRDVISYWEKTSMEHVIKKFWPDKINCNGTRTMLYKWKACKEELRSLPTHCNVLKIRPNGASTVLPPDMAYGVQEEVQVILSATRTTEQCPRRLGS